MDNLEERVTRIEKQIIDLSDLLQSMTRINHENEKRNLEGFKLMNTALEQTTQGLSNQIAIGLENIRSEFGAECPKK